MKKTLRYLIFAAIFAGMFIAPNISHATVFTVTVSSNQFSPASIPNVVVGDTIHFVWSAGNHTTTSTTIPAGANSWNTPMNSSGDELFYTVTVPGTYNYKCNNHIGMAGSFTATGPLEVASLKLENLNMAFFPNPVKQNLNIRFNYSENESAGMAKVYDLLGREVQHNKIELKDGINNAVIAMDDLKSGVYIVEVFAGNYRIGIKRITKE